MAYRIENIYLRRLTIIFLPVCLALVGAWFLDWVKEGYKGFLLYSREANENAEKRSYEIGKLLRESWDN